MLGYDLYAQECINVYINYKVVVSHVALVQVSNKRACSTQTCVSLTTRAIRCVFVMCVCIFGMPDASAIVADQCSEFTTTCNLDNEQTSSTNHPTNIDFVFRQT